MILDKTPSLSGKHFLQLPGPGALQEGFLRSGDGTGALRGGKSMDGHREAGKAFWTDAGPGKGLEGDLL